MWSSSPNYRAWTNYYLSSGHASICPEGRLLLVETLHKGVDLYELPGSSPLCTFTVPSKYRRCTKDVEFAECATAIVTGSDHGAIYIFSTDRPEPTQILRQAGPRSLIQAIDVRHRKIVLLNLAHKYTMQTATTPDFHYIASASSDKNPELSLWRKPVSVIDALIAHVPISLNVSDRF